MPQITLASLKNLLRSNVCEIEFLRRRPKAGRPSYRKMMCTLCNDLLNSTNGRISLNYRPPVHGLPYNAESKNLLPVWDIFMQDWRMVNMDACNLLNTIKADDSFWKYYNENLYTMSAQDKINYMDT
jgi:hypothetical protein